VLGVGIDVPLVIDPFRLALRLAFRWTYAARDAVPDETDVTFSPRSCSTSVCAPASPHARAHARSAFRDG